MKLNKNKIIVSALALVIGTSLAGSVTGTLAWYQYSTRANVSFLGESSGISSNLQMRFKGENDTKWRTRITKEEMETHLGQTGTELVPMTFGGLNMTDALPVENNKLVGYVQPYFGQADMTKWTKAAEKHYAQFQLELRVNERDGELDNNVDAKNVAKEVYLSKLHLEESVQNGASKGDISEAVRVHISASYNDGSDHVDNKLISKNGGTTITHGVLDLDNDGKVDKEYPDNDEFGFGHTADQMVNINYGGTTSVQHAFAALDESAQSTYYTDADVATEETVYPALVKSTGNVLSETAKQNIPNVGEIEKYIGKTMADETKFLTVTVTVWVEGWHRFDYSSREGTPKFDAIWDEANLAGAKFDLGLQFAVQDAFAE